MKKTYAFLFSCFIFFSVLFVHFILSYRIQTEIKYREDDKIIYAKDKFKAQVLKSFEQQAELLHFFRFKDLLPDLAVRILSKTIPTTDFYY